MLGQIKLYKGLDCILLPVRNPRENEQMGRLDLAVLSMYGERPATDAVTTHHPLSAWPQVRLHLSSLKSSFGSPPLDSLGGIGQRLKNAFRRRFDNNLLDDCVVCANGTHRFLSFYLLGLRRTA
jgi:hypothetical protein